jgi:hypothetical protein
MGEREEPVLEAAGLGVLSPVIHKPFEPGQIIN